MQRLGPKSVRTRPIQKKNSTGTSLDSLDSPRKKNKSIAYKTYIQFCSQTFDFKDQNSSFDQKITRFDYLKELTHLLKEPSNIVNIFTPNLEEVFNMIGKNLFRPLPTVIKSGPTEDTMCMDVENSDPSWPHLIPVYEFFYRLITNDNFDIQNLKKCITFSFIQQVFSSPTKKIVFRIIRLRRSCRT